MNAGGLRKNEISPGELRASDIFELLPFENALVALEVNGAQLAKLLAVVTRDAQAGARIQFKWNDQNRAEFISGKLVDENGQEQEIDPQKMYTMVTIDYLVKLGTGAYALLQEAKSQTPLNVTLRDAVMDYVKAETAAGRDIRSRLDNRFVQVGPDRKAPRGAEMNRSSHFLTTSAAFGATLAGLPRSLELISRCRCCRHRHHDPAHQRHALADRSAASERRERREGRRRAPRDAR